MTQTDFWASVLRQMDVYERSHAESSKAAARREMEFQHTLDTIGIALTMQNRVLLRIEQVLQDAGEKGKAKEALPYDDELAEARGDFLFNQWARSEGEKFHGAEEDSEAPREVPIVFVQAGEVGGTEAGSSSKGAETGGGDDAEAEEEKEAEETA